MQYILPLSRVEELVDQLEGGDDVWDRVIQTAREAGATSIALNDEELYELTSGGAIEGDGGI
jgi:hypothetical protein